MSTNLDLSRRKLLGALGTIGGAAALGGASTLAYFSDEEQFANNRLVAGELDLKVDWQEHYSDWSLDENDDNVPEPNNFPSPDDEVYGPIDDPLFLVDFDGDGSKDFAVQMVDPPGSPAADGLIGFPTQQTAMVQVLPAYADDFLRNTAIEAYPDGNNDGIQDRTPGGQALFPDGQGGVTTDICASASDLDGVLEDPDYRTNGTVGDPPNAQTTTPGDPLINISDVKPGDFGEVTLSFHLCGNPGYLWLTSRLHEASTGENGTTDPERADPGEFEGVVELLNEIRVAGWYDFDGNVEVNTATDGDNVVNEEQYLFGESGDLTLAEFLSFSGLGPDGIPLDGNPYNINGEAGADQLACADVSSDPEWKIDRDGLLSAAGAGTATVGPNGEITIDDVIIDQDGEPVGFDFTFDPDAGVGEGVCGFTITEQDGDVQERGDTAGCIRDSVFILSEDIEPIETLGFDYCELRAPSVGDPVRDCFENSNDYYVGFAWWLPVDHANEIQTDSVGFDIGFYTEQCRHNDGSGQAPEG